MMVYLEEGMTINRDQMLRKLVDIQYQRSDYDFHRGTFRVRGDIVEIFPAYEDRSALRLEFFGETIESIGEIDPIRGKLLRRVDKATVYPASHYVTGQERMKEAVPGIRRGAQRASPGTAQSTANYSRPSAWNSARFTISSYWTRWAFVRALKTIRGI